MKNNRAFDNVSISNQLELNLFDALSNYSEQFEKRFIANNMNLTNREIAERLNTTIGHVRNIERKFDIYRNDEQCRTIRSRLSQEQTGCRNPHWKQGRSKENYFYKKRHAKKYPEKIKAREAVRRAVKNEKLKRLPCFCGNPNSQAHHYNGYDSAHALDVKWLCRKHHREVDAYLKKGIGFEEAKKLILSNSRERTAA